MNTKMRLISTRIPKLSFKNKNDHTQKITINTTQENKDTS